jgi:hypothetical protein
MIDLLTMNTIRPVSPVQVPVDRSATRYRSVHSGGGVLIPGHHWLIGFTGRP